VRFLVMNKIEQLPFLGDSSNPVGWLVHSLHDFVVDSRRLVLKCTKPNMNEFMKIAQACSFGFLVMGMIGFVVKLVFIPINNIIIGGQ